MSEEACAMVCGLLSAICTVLSWYAMMEGDWKCMVVTLVFSIINVFLIGYVLAVKYCH